jgi:DUF4097 and DUF4098 domain-containing protein YvlB
MIRFLIRLMALAIVASLPIPLHAQKPETTEKIAKSFRVGPSGTLDINNMSGKVVVNEGGTDTIVIDALKRVRGNVGDAKDQLARTTVEMAERAGRVEVRTIYAGRNLKVSVDYTVTAPAGTTVAVRTLSGDIAITGIKGEVRADALSGNVTLTGTPAVSLAKTMSGDVAVTGVSTQGELRVSSLSGDVLVRSARARSVDADSTSGDVTLIDVTSDRVTGKALSGEISFTGPLAKGGRYQFQSQSGDVSLTLVGAAGFELDASTFSGRVRSDFPLTLPPGQPVGGQGPRKSIRGVFGDGGAQLLLRAFSGDITIAKK